MPVEVLLASPSHSRVEDSPEHSFSTSIRRAVDTLFTYQHIIDPLQAKPEVEGSDEFVQLWKQVIIFHLEDRAKAAVTALLEVFAKVQSGELETTRDETRGMDPYVIAEAAYSARIDQLQQSGDLRRPSEITSEYDQENHFDDLAHLYEETCEAMGLAFPPPLRDGENLPAEE